ncbi:MAG TPA: tetratricopeptide repeat protein [Thermoanaerobaculia bacterium]|nr:tetratricopeptide repeat protein [Thermoanaerobaculia bacterium]
MSQWPASLAAAALLALLLLGAVPLPVHGAAADTETALVEGNRRFRDGDYEGAFETYAAGYGSGSSNPVLAYNLGVAAHRLERLPEAILWYRRAQLSLGADPWLQDNLELARSALGTPERPRPPGARWVERRSVFLLAGTVLAWSLLLLALRSPSSRQRRRWPVALAAALSLLFFAAGTLLGRLGPQAAVLLADCPGVADGGLPSGTEVWVRGDDSGWRVLGEPEAVCPVEAVALVEDPAVH